MAYRQLCAAAFVILGLGVACGGGTASSAVDPNVDDDPAPSSGETPPNSSDDSPPSDDDSPPSNPDVPPSSPDSPGGGGRLQQLCEDLCELYDRLEDCPADPENPNEMPTPMVGELCRNGGCAMAVDPGMPVPCLDEIEGFFGCFTSIPNICAPSETDAQQCLDEAETFSECIQDVQPVDPNPDPPDPEVCAPPACSCEDDCTECYCENVDLGADVGAFCADVCPELPNQ